MLIKLHKENTKINIKNININQEKYLVVKRQQQQILAVQIPMRKSIKNKNDTMKRKKLEKSVRKRKREKNKNTALNIVVV